MGITSQFCIAAALGAILPSCAEPPVPESSQLLASNTVVAVYEKTLDRPCRHLTALCPDRCGHADRLAVFRILSNEQYRCLSPYGDPKAEPGSELFVSVLKDEDGQAPCVRRLVDKLRPGEKVRFTVEHRYVDKGSSCYPARPVTRIERVSSPLPPEAGPQPETLP